VYASWPSRSADCEEIALLEFDVDSIDASDLELVLVTADGEICPLA
jgi:hypothetical protein